MGALHRLPTRESVREQLRTYMSQTGWSVSEVAFRAGYSRRTIMQFISGARFSEAHGVTAARNLARFIADNPAPLPEFPGRLYETQATRKLDRLLEHARGGGWGTAYGPAGSQKTFLLEYRAAEAARSQENEIALVGADPLLSPRALLGRIARGLAAPWAQQTEALRDGILFALRRRRSPVAVVIDEAQLLHSRIDTLETLRRLGDKAAARMGILVVGNEQVLQLFEPRRKVYFEQWRSRIEQEEVRVLGPTVSEARHILCEEIPGIKSAAADEVIARTTVRDPLSRLHYVNARRLFNVIRVFQRTTR